MHRFRRAQRIFEARIKEHGDGETTRESPAYETDKRRELVVTPRATLPKKTFVKSVTSAGIEPATCGLGIRCSIRLSYEASRSR